MGRVSDGANRHGNSARLHACRRMSRPGLKRVENWAIRKIVARPVAHSPRGQKLRLRSCRCRAVDSSPMLARVRAVTPIRAGRDSARQSPAEVGAADTLIGSAENANTRKKLRDRPRRLFAHAMRQPTYTASCLTVAGRSGSSPSPSRTRPAHAAKRRRSLALAWLASIKSKKPSRRCQSLGGPASTRSEENRRKRQSNGDERRERGERSACD